VLVTLVCCYAACWEATKGRGVRDVATRMTKHLRDNRAVQQLAYLQERPRVPFPFFVGLRPNGGPTEVYFWFFGYVTKLRDVP